MYAIVGLGNPGDQYERTRHNVGFRVIEALSSRCNIGLMAGGEGYEIGTGTYQEAGFFIVRPRTYMNNSGLAVERMMEDHMISADRLLVVCDDCNLPLGKIRLRRSGSDGGHNGLASVIEVLGTEAFPRLRVGIDQPPSDVELVDYVLGEFDVQEEESIEGAVVRATDAILSILSDGLEQAMNTFN